jgi:hypothetical protein
MTKDEWRREIRSTVIHEVKHLTMFAEKFASPTAENLEESWLEEGTAMHAEELYMRSITGAQFKGNTPYGSVSAPNFIFCEVRPSGSSGCPADRPLAMFSLFYWLSQYLGNTEDLTMLGSSPSSSSDASFYGTSWLFQRWVVDQYSSDPVYFKALIQEPILTGVDNVVARIGHPWPELLADFLLALAVDDRPGFSPSRPQLTEPSWNIRDNFAGLNADFSNQGIFTSPFPLRTRPVSFGDFVVDVPSLRAGSASYFELSGTQGAKQLIELRSQGGNAPAPSLRIAIVRVQ